MNKVLRRLIQMFLIITVLMTATLSALAEEHPKHPPISQSDASQIARLISKKSDTHPYALFKMLGIDQKAVSIGICSKMLSSLHLGSDPYSPLINTLTELSPLKQEFVRGWREFRQEVIDLQKAQKEPEEINIKVWFSLVNKYSERTNQMFGPKGWIEARSFYSQLMIHYSRLDTKRVKDYQERNQSGGSHFGDPPDFWSIATI